MKHQQVIVDYFNMIRTSGTCLCVVFSGWVLFKLVQAIFWLPGYLEKNGDRLYEHLEKKFRHDTKDKVKTPGDYRMLPMEKGQDDGPKESAKETVEWDKGTEKVEKTEKEEVQVDDVEMEVVDKKNN